MSLSLPAAAAGMRMGCLSSSATLSPRSLAPSACLSLFSATASVFSTTLSRRSASLRAASAPPSRAHSAACQRSFFAARLAMKGAQPVSTAPVVASTTTMLW